MGIYNNVINKNDLKINWDRVNILTNKNKNNIKNVIANLPEPIHKIKIRKESKVMGYMMCT